MIAWSIEAARESGCFDHIAVSTDDDEIATVARKWGTAVRPAAAQSARHSTCTTNRRSFRAASVCCAPEIGSGESTQRRSLQPQRQQGVGVNLHYIPVHIQPWNARMGFRSEDFPHAMDYYQEALTLPVYPTLTESDQTALVAALEQAVTT